MADALEKSLDDLIGDETRQRDYRRIPRHPRRDRDRSRERNNRPNSGSYRERERDRRYEAPRQTKLQRLSHGKAYIKITNLHYEISESDLRDLFETVGETSFVLIEFTPSGRSTGIAYVGFLDLENNKLAVEKFDGKKAVGEYITVEEIRPLNITAASKGSRGSFRGHPRGPSRGGRRDNRGHNGRSKRPTVDQLDDELNRYMNKEESKEESEPREELKKPSGRRPKPTVEDLDKELDSYMNDKPFPAV